MFLRPALEDGAEGSSRLNTVCSICRRNGVLLTLSLVSAATAQYSARRDGEVVRLEDAAHLVAAP